MTTAQSFLTRSNAFPNPPPYAAIARAETKPAGASAATTPATAAGDGEERGVAERADRSRRRDAQNVRARVQNRRER